MLEFVQRHAACVIGLLSGFDRFYAPPTQNG